MKRKITFLTAALALLAFLAIPMGVWGQAPVGTTLWGETWTGGDANETPSAYGFEGTTVYGGATLTYAQSSTNTKLYEEALAGGESPELLLSKSNQTWTISNIPTGQATGMALTFNSNKTTFDVTSTTTGITISGSQKSWTIATTSSVTTFNLTIKNTGSSNARIDDIVLSVTTAGGDTPQPTTYTVTYDCNGGTSGCPQNVTGIEPNTQIQLADAPSKDGFDFDGWSDGNTTYGENEDYTVTGNVTFTAQWTENTTPTPEGETATLNIQAYAEANEWVSGTKYATATVAPVTFTANGGGNTGKYYSNGQDWRFYQNESASITISVAEGYTLVSVTPTYSVSNGGVLKNGDTTIASGTTVNVSGTSVTFTVGNSGSATNGQVRFTNIDVVYVSDGGTQTASDLAITNESTDLTFDLYNNTTAQVISYTTSSTGAITITPAESDYFSYVHDATAKTITVTPLAVTPSAQTVTISQAADDDFYAGTATFTVSVANSDPNIPGTENNPYTVAQARAAIDANSGTQGVYATGIVTEIVTAYNSQYGNISFNFSDEGTTTPVLEAYRCGGDEAANVAVGDVVVVYGNLTKYGSTYEFGQGCTLVSLTHPAITTPVVTVTPNTINAPAEGADGTLALTYENIEEFISFDYYFCDADGNELEDTDPDYPGDWIYAEINDENDAYTLSYIIDANDGAARTAYMKVYTFDDNAEEVYDIVTVNQAEYVAPTYATLPFEFTQGRDAVAETNGLYQEGLGTDYNGGNNATTPLKFDHTGDWLLLQFNERPGTLNFDITGNGFSGGTFTVQTSEDGVTYTDLETYTELGDTQHESFDNLGENVRYIKWIYTNKENGNVGLGNIHLYKYGEGPAPVASITVNPDEVNVNAEDHDGTLDLTYENLTITDLTDFDIQYYDADGEEANVPDWVEVLVAEQDPEIGEGYVVSYWMMENEGAEARTVYFKVYALDDEAELVYSNLVTVTQAAPETPATPGTWVLTSLADLTEDDIFVIVGDNGDTYAMSNDQGTQHAPATVAVTVTEGTLSGEPDANIQWNLEITNDGYVFYPNGTTESWLYCINDNNGVRVGTGEAKHFTLDNTSGYLTITETTDQRYLGIYNSQDWRCYKNTTGNIAGQTFTFYKKVETLPANSIVIEGYANCENPDGGYYLIASPFTVAPAQVPGMTDGSFDLYYFTDEEEAEWINYKNEDGSINQNFGPLTPGNGYLYAHETDVILTFDGEPYEGNGEVTLSLNANNTGSWKGWNLVGNPYTETAYIDRDFYVLNGDGSEIVPSDTRSYEVAPMQGIFVVAAHDEETMTFSTDAGTTDPEGKIVLNVRKDRNMVIDRAMIRFGEGRQLPKFMLNPDNTKLYIAQNGEDYAVVRSIDENITPVSFSAAENGTYTISVNAEEIEMEYLHLVDNMTGADIDLLATPSYTFDARTTDYTSRFNLVFATTNGVNENSESHFAFYNGSEWVINNMGNATLQVVDVTGRVLSSESIKGNAHISLQQVPGVYMMRLVNGDNVKVQKVVVR